MEYFSLGICEQTHARRKKFIKAKSFPFININFGTRLNKVTVKYSGFRFSVIVFSDIVHKMVKSSSIYAIKGQATSDDDSNTEKRRRIYFVIDKKKNDDFMFIVANGFFM